MKGDETTSRSQPMVESTKALSPEKRCRLNRPMQEFLNACATRQAIKSHRRLILE
jgi:hypothetical protein